MWTKQVLCKLAVGSEYQFHTALRHLAAVKRLLLLGLEGRSDPAFPKPSSFVRCSPRCLCLWLAG